MNVCWLLLYSMAYFVCCSSLHSFLTYLWHGFWISLPPFISLFFIFQFYCITMYAKFFGRNDLFGHSFSLFRSVTSFYQIDTWLCYFGGVFRPPKRNSFISVVFVKLLCDYFMVLFLFCHGTCQLDYTNAEKTTINTLQQLSFEIQFSHDYTIHLQKVRVKNEEKLCQQVFI